MSVTWGSRALTIEEILEASRQHAKQLAADSHAQQELAHYEAAKAKYPNSPISFILAKAQQLKQRGE